MPAAGIDVATDRVHVVVLDDARRVTEGWVHDPRDAGGLVARLVEAGVRRAGVDAPDGPSAAAHAGDDTLSAKFRTARCGEIALGRAERIWVSWPTPAAAPFAGWMMSGFALYDAARAAGLAAIEVYPHAVFRTLAGGRIATKTSPAGIAARVSLLEAQGVDGGPHLALWSHDGLDAAAAALVALDESARCITCGHDGSAIWLPGYRPAP